jgi:predicted MFS family arabinose efflux permease
VLTDLLSWRWILFINVPIGILVLVVARFAIVESIAEGERPTLDWAGALTVTGGLVALVYGIVSTDAHAWGSSLVVGYLVAGVALLAVFLAIETRHPHPLVPLRLFRSRSLTGANLMMIIIGSVMFSLFFFLSQFVQDVQHYSALRTGFAFLPMPIAIIIGTQISSRLVARVGPRTLLVIAPLVSAIGLLLLSRLHEHSSYLLHVGIPGAITTFGVGLSFVPITLAATGGVARHEAGLASGLINTTRQIGGSLGLAALLTIVAARTNALRSAGALVAQTGGYTRAFAVGSVLMVGAAVIAVLVLPPLRAPDRAPESQANEPSDLAQALATE